MGAAQKKRKKPQQILSARKHVVRRNELQKLQGVKVRRESRWLPIPPTSEQGAVRLVSHHHLFDVRALTSVLLFEATSAKNRAPHRCIHLSASLIYLGNSLV